MKGLFLAAAFLLVSTSASAQTCSNVHDHYHWFGGNDYNHVVEGYGTSLACWSTPSSLGTVSITSDTCGDGFTFTGWSPTLEQVFSTGSGNSGQTWSLSYELDFDDPNDSSASFINVLVYADNQLVAYDAYNGSNADVMCSPRTVAISSNLSNKSVRVSVQARTAYTNVLIRVRSLGLWQHFRY